MSMRPANTAVWLSGALFLTLCTQSPADAAEAGQKLRLTPAPQTGRWEFDFPPSHPAAETSIQNESTSRARSETLQFGYVDNDGFAILGETWTFDHGGPDPLEGWYAEDLTGQTGTYFRHLSAAAWNSDPTHDVPAPLLSGGGSAYVGAFGSEANALCWAAGLGYGNDWCQTLTSPVYNHDGISDVPVSWLHFNDTEPDFDYIYVYLQLLPSGNRVELRAYDGQIGLAPDHPISAPVGAADAELLDAADFQGESSYQIVIEMVSDGGWSDEDGSFTTVYGPGGFDNISIDGNLTDFETGLGGWVAEACPGDGGSHENFGVADVSNYNIGDDCDCDLSGNVLKFHDENGEQPEGTNIVARTPRVDLLNDVDLPGAGQLRIFAQWTQYVDLPVANGVVYRPGWEYYPEVCEATGEEGWSERVGQSTYFFSGSDPACQIAQNTGTDADVPVPADAEQVRFLYEIYSSCDAFTIPDCSGITNFTPLLDNAFVGVTRETDAPSIVFGQGARYQDGFAQNTVISDPSEPGNADVTGNRNFEDTEPVVLGDSLYVLGPFPSDASTQWEAKLWFRLPHVGPLADSRYTSWRDRVADGHNIDDPGAANFEFTFAYMDSFQIGTNATPNRFLSYFREDDDDYDGSGGELTEANEIIADGVLFPGTQVEYFVTSNYVGNPEHFLLPDTSGGFALEFEILPRWRDDEGTLRFPCLLYVDAFNSGAEFFITEALESVGVDHDRYDYLDPFNGAPMARGLSPESNNGCTLQQLLGYRGILVNTGSQNAQLMYPSDYVMFGDWLTASVCSETDRRGLIWNGDGGTTAAESAGSTFLSSHLGVEAVASSYGAYSGDLNDCVRVESPAPVGSYETVNSEGDYVYNAFGNACPTELAFDVLAPIGSGVGNRVYQQVDDLGSETEYAQVTNENLVANYRTVVDGVSYHHITVAEEGGACVGTEAGVIEAAANELRSALEWIYGVGNLPGLCEEDCAASDVENPWTGPADVQSDALHAARPNPFNPRTTVRFQLSQSGPVDISVFDAGGRRVRSLVSGAREAGSHDVVWDGRDDHGNALSAGVYWMKMKAGGFDYASRVVRVN